MLFHSPEFLFGFLPVCVAGFFVLGRYGGRRASLVWFIAASLVFYGWWNPNYLWLIGGSIVVNYVLGNLLAREGGRRRTLLIFGVALNLSLLAYYKYAHFFLDSMNAVAGTSYTMQAIILPLGISFFTFEQISWLVEVYQRRIAKTRFLEYCVFITNFPKFIAGPIIRPHELLPQLQDSATFRFRAEHLSVGLTIFALGLFKKVVLADAMVPLVGPVFHAAAGGASVSFLEAWAATLAFGLQIYFDFSGYSDMAIGSARMFGLRLPLNFHSPYRAGNITDFWRRWHMSLTRYLRDYVYIPLGGNRVIAWKRFRNVLCTMLLSGLWHGAGWTFVVWGGMHGLALCMHQLWRSFRPATDVRRWWGRGASWFLTFVTVMVGWVFFRAETMRSAWHMIRAMAGADGVALPGMTAASLGRVGSFLADMNVVRFDLQQALILPSGTWIEAFPWIVALLIIALFLPNTQQWMRAFSPALEVPKEKEESAALQRLAWRPSVLHAACVAAITVFALIFLMLNRQTEFLYFQF